MKWLALIFLCSCAQVTSLNLKKHEFGVQPTKIIWFQIAGLEEEQLAMLRFNEAAEKRTSFENNTCLGKTWNYNLYDLRNSAYSTFLTQLTGKKNIKMSCEDAELRPIWSYLYKNGYHTGIIEMGAKDNQSLLPLSRCGDSGGEYLKNVYMWQRTEPPKDAPTYIYSQIIPMEPGKAHYDRTCTTKSCTSTIVENFKAIYASLNRVSHKHLFIIRDFTYLEALEQKDFIKARRILADLEAAYAEVMAQAKDSSHFLALLTSGESKYVDMPDAGKNWYEFEKLGKGAQVKRTKLTNLVLASGARAENFCGIYEDAQVFDRILSGPKQQGLELKIINPFK